MNEELKNRLIKKIREKQIDELEKITIKNEVEKDLEIFAGLIGKSDNNNLQKKINGLYIKERVPKDIRNCFKKWVLNTPTLNELNNKYKKYQKDRNIRITDVIYYDELEDENLYKKYIKNRGNKIIKYSDIEKRYKTTQVVEIDLTEPIKKEQNIDQKKIRGNNIKNNQNNKGTTVFSCSCDSSNLNKMLGYIINETEPKQETPKKIFIKNNQIRTISLDTYNKNIISKRMSPNKGRSVYYSSCMKNNSRHYSPIKETINLNVNESNKFGTNLSQSSYRCNKSSNVGYHEINRSTVSENTNNKENEDWCTCKLILDTIEIF